MFSEELTRRAFLRTGSSFFLGKVTALGVLCCFALFVCLTLLVSFFLPSQLSFKNMYMYTCTNVVLNNKGLLVLKVIVKKYAGPHIIITCPRKG